MPEVDVLVAGAGPTGLTLALEMARRGHQPRIVDRRAAPFGGSRGKGLTARTQEVFDEALCPFPDSSSWQFQGVPLADIDPDGHFPEPSLDYFQRILDDIAVKPGVLLSRPSWLSTYRVNVRMVDRLRVRRVFLAGDAAHVHSPAAGLGMNTGIQDSYNLGWTLSAVLSGADEALLDTYQEERLPVAAWTLSTSSAGLQRIAEQFAAEDSLGIAAAASKDGHQLAGPALPH
jgi:2-polyprenyl-6-methoxyphenol hydroxylase-like FAD-dependent oxidoreductase